LTRDGDDSALQVSPPTGDRPARSPCAAIAGKASAAVRAVSSPVVMPGGENTTTLDGMHGCNESSGCRPLSGSLARGRGNPATSRIPKIRQRGRATNDRVAANQFANIGAVTALWKGRGSGFGGRQRMPQQVVSAVIEPCVASTPTTMRATGAKMLRAGAAAGHPHGAQTICNRHAQQKPPATRWFLGHCSDHGASAASRREGLIARQRPFPQTTSGIPRPPPFTWDTQAHRPAESPRSGQFRLGQPTAAPFGGDLPGPGLMSRTRGAHRQWLCGCRVSQSTRCWPGINGLVHRGAAVLRCRFVGVKASCSSE